MYFVPKIILTYCEKKCSSDQKKVLKFEAEGLEFCKIFEIIRTIYSNIETEYFLTCSRRFLIPKKLEQLEFKLKKNYWDLETLEKTFCLNTNSPFRWFMNCDV